MTGKMKLLWDDTEYTIHGCMAFSTFYSVYYTINLNIPFTNLNYLLSFKYTMYVDQDQSKCDWCSPGRAYGVDSG